MDIIQFLESEKYNDSILLREIVEDTFSKIEMMPTNEKIINKLKSVISNSIGYWYDLGVECCGMKEDKVKINFEKQRILCLFLSQIFIRCREVKIYLTKEIGEDMFSYTDFFNDFFYVDYYGGVFGSIGNNNWIIREDGQYSAQWYYDHVFKFCYFAEEVQNELQPQLPLHEWQKIDPLPIMPDNLREKEDFARAVFYYAEKDRYLKLENNRYTQGNIKLVLLAYMCLLILYYGDKEEKEYLKMNLPKPDYFSIYFFGTDKEQNGYILNKARADILSDFSNREKAGKRLKPIRAEEIEKIVKKAYNELHPQNA